MNLWWFLALIGPCYFGASWLGRFLGRRLSPRPEPERSPEWYEAMRELDILDGTIMPELPTKSALEVIHEQHARVKLMVNELLVNTRTLPVDELDQKWALVQAEKAKLTQMQDDLDDAIAVREVGSTQPVAYHFDRVPDWLKIDTL